MIINGSQSVVNIHIFAFTYFQVGGIRIRFLNISQSDEMIEKNKASFPRIEEYILFILILIEPIVVLLLCMLSVNI